MLFIGLEDNLILINHYLINFLFLPSPLFFLILLILFLLWGLKILLNLWSVVDDFLMSVGDYSLLLWALLLQWVSISILFTQGFIVNLHSFLILILFLKRYFQLPLILLLLGYAPHLTIGNLVLFVTIEEPVAVNSWRRLLLLLLVELVLAGVDLRQVDGLLI